MTLYAYRFAYQVLERRGCRNLSLRGDYKVVKLVFWENRTVVWEDVGRER